MICATSIIAIAGMLTALAAIGSTYYARRALSEQQRAISDQRENFDRQLAQYRLTLSADATLRFVARFEDPHFKEIRSKAAKALLNKNDENQAEDVFDFFDTLSLFVNLGALTNEIAYSVFFHWINLYWRAGKHYIGSRQKDTASLWTGFEALNEKVCEIEKRNSLESEDLKMPDDRLRRQLQEEVDLLK